VRNSHVPGLVVGSSAAAKACQEAGCEAMVAGSDVVVAPGRVLPPFLHRPCLREREYHRPSFFRRLPMKRRPARAQAAAARLLSPEGAPSDPRTGVKRQCAGMFVIY